ncbi:MAG: DNA repair protein RecO [Dysgonamonadaceae bacterium]|jgi:DNA repair protein RecO (recombination protein O)|nr:DNA repair protein RecO [Dysgonamonadaceae bacterium]
MQHKTQGIVLHSTPYSDRFSITIVYTEKFGRMSYLTIRTAGRSKSQIPKALLHPLATLDMVVEHQNLREIQRIKEVKILFPLITLTSNPVKNAIGLFIAELFGKVVREMHPNRELFGFFLQSIRTLEETEKPCANFHLAFMLELGGYLGFTPDGESYLDGAFFDLRNGRFTALRPSHPHFLNPDDSYIFSLLIRMNYANMHVFRFLGDERRTIVEHILSYYRLHLDNFPEIKSVGVLHEVFR